MYVRNRFGIFLLMYLAGPIYYCIWASEIQNSRRAEGRALTGGMTVLLLLLTFGFYHIIWQWRTCAWLRRKTGHGRRIITLILSLLFIGWIINPLVIQGQINRYLKRKY